MAIAQAWYNAAGEDWSTCKQMIKYDTLWQRPGNNLVEIKKKIQVLQIQKAQANEEEADTVFSGFGTSLKFVAGEFAVIHGLKSQAEWNGHSALLMSSVLTKGPSQGRIRVLPDGKGAHFLAVKVDNLAPVPAVRLDEKIHRRCMFLPTLQSHPVQKKDTLVHSPPDWPSDWTTEEEYLRSKHRWGHPQLLSGITSRGQAKPDFQMYFDADDEESPTNHIATAMYNLLPFYEQSKSPRPPSGKICGPCVLIFSPMKSTFYDSRAKESVTTVSASQNKQWSLRDFQTVLCFHTSGEALEQYQLHDDPMHHMLGGL